ncbi:cytochrome P450 71D10-like [Neltuma alba]|uniref:cytochrome P450 71D10-like n=1 Tax=Neltuma alba TaxID=207710 RepID=UPI0010A49871|nr:cytochrome P450 71D10-like [Prosopis alba]
MEIQIPYSIIFTFFCFFFLICKLSSSSKKLTKTLLPGPWKLPLIGNLHQLASSLPHRSLTNLANKYGPFMHLQLGQVSHIIVSSPEYAKEIMKTHDQIFANRPKNLATDIFAYNSTDIAVSPYGNYWRQLRKILKKLELTNYIVARVALGKKTKNVEHVLQNLEQVTKLSSALSIFDFYPSLKFISVITGTRARMMKLHKDGDKVFDDIIGDHEEKEKNNVGEAEQDLVDVLLRIQKDNDFEIPLSLENIKAVLKDVFFAGTETTATTINWTMSELLRDPEAMKEAQTEVRIVYGSKGYVDESELHQLKYLSAVIKETLRLHPPVVLIPRENSESCEINGYVISPKTKIIINSWAIGRDPKIWNEPERFEPKRFFQTMDDYNFKSSNFEYIPFGGGRRICPGITFATSILELLLSNLLYHFDWKLPKEMKAEGLDMDESFGAVVARKKDLSVIPFRYSP